MIQMTFQSVELPLAKPFAISRGIRTAVTVVRVYLTDGEFTAVGNAHRPHIIRNHRTALASNWNLSVRRWNRD